MHIKVRLFATLREGRQKEYTMEFPEKVSASDIIDRLNINIRDVAILLINGIDHPLESELNDSDIVSVFPPVGGG